jgi:S1-C subfamily serine protease
MNPDKPSLDVDRPESMPPSPAAISDSAQSPENRRMWHLVLPTCFMLAVVMLLANVLPLTLVHWRRAEAQADADAIYLKRRAELKAEAEVAGAELELIDKKVGLVALGFRLVVSKVSPSVVNIASFKEVKRSGVFPKGPVLYESDKDRKFIGSGVLIKAGHVLTNYHVVKDADRVRVSFASGRVVEVEAAAVVSDPVTDLAVVKLPDDISNELKEDLKQSAVFADSEKDIEVGDWALAIGSPLDLRQTVTVGVISAKGRLLDKLDMVELLQTDAAINLGNSGGPLFDQRGRVVGINVALASDERGVSRGIGFAIPSNTARKIADALIERGEVSRGYLGIGLEELIGPKAKALGAGAAVVVKVTPGEAGDKAGLKPGDVIVKFNNVPLLKYQAVRHLRQLIVDVEPGHEVVLELYRDEVRRDLKATVSKRPLLE